MGARGLRLRADALGLVRSGGEHRPDPTGQLQELPASGRVRQQLPGFFEVGPGLLVPRQEVLPLAGGGGELVLGPADVGVDLETVVAGHDPAEHRSRLEDRGQVAGDIQVRVVGMQLGGHPHLPPYARRIQVPER